MTYEEVQSTIDNLKSLPFEVGPTNKELNELKQLVIEMLNKIKYDDVIEFNQSEIDKCTDKLNKMETPRWRKNNG